MDEMAAVEQLGRDQHVAALERHEAEQDRGEDERAAEEQRELEEAEAAAQSQGVEGEVAGGPETAPAEPPAEDKKDTRRQYVVQKFIGEPEDAPGEVLYLLVGTSEPVHSPRAAVEQLVPDYQDGDVFMATPVRYWTEIVAEVEEPPPPRRTLKVK